MDKIHLVCRIARAPITSACVLCNRFFTRQSFAAHDRHVCRCLNLRSLIDVNYTSVHAHVQLIAAACLFLAVKIEEMHKKVKHFVSIAYCCRYEVESLPFAPGSDAFKAFRDQILEAERRVLYTLEMDMAVDHPYATITDVIKQWRNEKFHIRGEKPPELPMLAKAAAEIAYDW